MTHSLLDVCRFERTIARLYRDNKEGRVPGVHTGLFCVIYMTNKNKR